MRPAPPGPRRQVTGTVADGSPGGGHPGPGGVPSVRVTTESGGGLRLGGGGAESETETRILAH